MKLTIEVDKAWGQGGRLSSRPTRSEPVRPKAERPASEAPEPEREALGKIMALGLQDAFRLFHEEAGHYTWWDYRTRGFEKGRGLRIDHFLLSAAAVETCSGVEIDETMRAGPKPSDHAPVIAHF